VLLLLFVSLANNMFLPPNKGLRHLDGVALARLERRHQEGRDLPAVRALCFPALERGTLLLLLECSEQSRAEQRESLTEHLKTRS
jgi:hypothetical protein